MCNLSFSVLECNENERSHVCMWSCNVMAVNLFTAFEISKYQNTIWFIKYQNRGSIHKCNVADYRF